MNTLIPYSRRTYMRLWIMENVLFPPSIATGEYYKYDYSEGIDISCYRNIKVPTSYMAAHSDFDFIGNYDEQLDAGLYIVADHHIPPERNSGPGETATSAVPGTGI